MAKYKAATQEEKIERAEHCNDLIKEIASYGRKFFYCQSNNKTAELLVSSLGGRVYFLDHKSSQLIYTHSSRTWNGFTHGGTLRALVESMRDYIMKGHHLNIDLICCKRIREEDGNIWGYESSEAIKLLETIKSNPIFGDTNV
ncbi:hypothetical protein VXS06_14695 [Photobacterium toruni]|uniref:Uncharacterized protein n=1 Tax=Photobacterium toruni TaxID=1935446 RepID=A0ABU6L9W8_9GAMM|nr:hypothetical protein [Photobacterium toruni]